VLVGFDPISINAADGETVTKGGKRSFAAVCTYDSYAQIATFAMLPSQMP